jgi:hypothetical protein
MMIMNTTTPTDSLAIRPSLDSAAKTMLEVSAAVTKAMEPWIARQAELKRLLDAAQPSREMRAALERLNGLNKQVAAAAKVIQMPTIPRETIAALNGLGASMEALQRKVRKIQSPVWPSTKP